MFHHRSSAKQKKKEQRKSGAKDRGSITKVNTTSLSKHDRQNTLRQMREQKREELLDKRRLGAWNHPPPPKVVVIIGFHENADPLSLKRRIVAACTGEDSSGLAAHHPATVVLPDWAKSGPGGGKPRALFIDPPRDTIAILDAVKCADLVLCVVGPHASLEEPAFDEMGYKLLTAVKSQGLPVVMGAIHGNETSMQLSAKKANESHKFVVRYFASELGAETKLFAASSDQEMKALVRGIGTCTPKDISWRADRGYLMAQDCEYSTADGMLALRGYVRGPGFICKNLVHLTGHGDFAVARISVSPDPCSAVPPRKGAPPPVERVVDEMKENPDLERLQPFDPTLLEQTFLPDEEMADSSTPSQKPRRKGAKSIPAPDAASVPIGEGDDDMEDDNDEEEEGGMDNDDDDEVSNDARSAIAETDDGWDVSSNMTGAADEPSQAMVESEKRRRALIARSAEDMEFPDEVDTPLNQPAKVRFQKYRGLKSFRTSAWDPYEDLPVEYSRIWEFEAFTSTGRSYKQQFFDECDELQVGPQEGSEGETGTSGLYCTLFLKGVPPTVMETQARGVPFVLSSLLPCEQKVSVVQGQVARTKDYDEVIKSKQEVWLHCGFRRFMSRPIYSEMPKKTVTSNKKFKFSRFLQHDVTSGISMYAPVMFPPARLLMFVNTEEGPQLAGTGSITGADPKQLVIKRSVITGYPFKVHKSKSVVRFMFFNPEDIRWFKPVELSTKKGLRGHIVESLGTHGYMKCRFNNHIRQDDTVCMNLYKRVYPKWYPPSWGGRATDGPEEAPCVNVI